MTISLKDVGSGYKRSAINSNFQAIEDEINDNLLSKNGGVGLEADLDFNGQRAINLAQGIRANDGVNLAQLNAVISAASTGIIASQSEVQLGSDAVNRVFNFVGVTYSVGANNLYVFRNGVKQTKVEDYNETTAGSITLTFDPNPTDVFEFLTNVSTTQVSTTSNNVTHSQDGDSFTVQSYLANRHVINIMDKGASPSASAADNTAAIQACLDLGGTIVIPEGTFNFTPPLTIDVDSTQVIGLSRTGSVLKTDSTASNALELGLSSGVTRCRLENFVLEGNSSNGHGVLLGSSTAGRYAISTTLRNLTIKSFSNTGFAGLDLRRAWWLDVEKCEFEGNYNNIQVRAGSTTTTLNFKDNTTIRNATNYGFYIDGAPNESDAVSFNSVSFEYNAMGAVKSTCDKVNFHLDNVYFEQNNGSGGTAVVDISADATVLANASILNMKRCVTDAPLGGATTIVLDGVRSSVIEDCQGWLAQPPTTTATCDITFRNLNGRSSADFLVTARSLLGNIIVQERDPATGRWVDYSSQGHLFEGHIGVNRVSTPTVAVGTGAGTTGASAIMKAGSTDTAGQVQVTRGTTGWLANPLATITFATAYANAPTVIISPASTSAAIQQRDLGMSVGTATTTGFTIDVATADSNSGLTYWNYMVIE